MLMKSTTTNPLYPFSRIDYLDPSEPSQEEILIQSSLLNLVRLRITLLHDGKMYVDLLKNTLAAAGETQNRIEEVASWKESALYNEKERAAFALVEALIAEPPVPVSPEVIREARCHFNDAEMIQLVLTIFSSSDWYHQKERVCRTYGT